MNQVLAALIFLIILIITNYGVMLGTMAIAEYKGYDADCNWFACTLTKQSTNVQEYRYVVNQSDGSLILNFSGGKKC